MHWQVSWFFMAIIPPIQVANIGIADSILLMVLALVVFGPRRLPEIGRKIGKLMYEFRKASNDFKFQMEEELRATEEAERRKNLEAQQAENQKRLAALEEAVAAKKSEDKPASETPTPAEPASSETASTETTPRIQPPSTGAPVEAARPRSFADAASAMAEMEIESALNPVPRPEVHDSSETPEPTTHHD
jgi:sec-independent protein translocase protein TatB